MGAWIQAIGTLLVVVIFLEFGAATRQAGLDDRVFGVLVLVRTGVICACER